MPRTTINIDAPILEDLKRLQRKERKSLGRLVSELLASAIHARRETREEGPVDFEWISRDMRARVDPDDKEALWAVLDQDRAKGSGGR